MEALYSRGVRQRPRVGRALLLWLCCLQWAANGEEPVNPSGQDVLAGAVKQSNPNGELVAAAGPGIVHRETTNPHNGPNPHNDGVKKVGSATDWVGEVP